MNPQEHATGPSPALDRDALRQRIAEALIRWTYRGQEPDPETGILETVRANAYSRADAVLAVLPAPFEAALPSETGPKADSKAATDRDGEELAKRVARAIWALKSPPPPGSQHYRSGWDDGLEAAIDAARDALEPAAVLPAPIPAAELANLRTMYDAVSARENDLIEERDQLLEAQSTGRAAVLREAADELGRMDYDTDSNDYGYDTYRDAWNGGVLDGAALLRGLAGEAQQDEARVDRTAVLLEAADELDRYVGLQSSDAAPEVYGARFVIRELRRIASGQPAREAQDPTQDGAEMCVCGHGPGAHDAKFSDPQCAMCPGDSERSWRHPFTPAAVARPGQPETGDTDG